MSVVIAALGVGIFKVLHLPVPFLFGPMTACLVAALVGLPLRGTGQVAVGARTILGVAIGSTITPALIATLPSMMLSVALIPPYIAVIALIGVPFFHRVCGLDAVTSYYASMPGGLQDMVIFGTEAGGDARALSLIHATRMLILLTLIPLILSHGFGASLSNPVGLPARDLPPFEMVWMAVAAIGGWKLAARVGMFGASILGPMLATAVLALLGVIDQRPPAEAILAAQFFIGIGIGVGYVGVTLAELRKFVLAGAAFVVILAGLAAAVTEFITYAGLARPIEGLLAFAPGGQADMTVLAIIVGADLGFVIVHHVVRVIIVITGAPIVARLLHVRRDG